EAAITSSRAGTTRDVVEVHLDLSGYPVILADTAGLREAGDEIEQEGIRRALARAADADLKLVLFDAAQEPDAQSLALLDDKAIAVLSKSDLTSNVMPAQAGIHGKDLSGKEAVAMDPSMRWDDHSYLKISAKTGEGISELLAAITARLKNWTEQNSAPPLTRARHREALAHTLQTLQKALQNVEKRQPHELTAEELRQAALALGRITGRVDVEDLLDVIFRDFCIGK
ncbi:MAG: 50S ribosome-binding GTPase, partial [Proteobacteria bacterium]|nr:50S ribosome-binding GTPase [Pseudomonadota bacterium]